MEIKSLIQTLQHNNSSNLSAAGNKIGGQQSEGQ
jgi:hypothetical protein